MHYWKVKNGEADHIPLPQELILATPHTKSGGNNMDKAYKGQRLKVDGHDNAIMGMGDCFGRIPVLVYDSEKIIRNLMENDSMTHEEALEFFDYNIVGSYNGPGMPIFLHEYEEL